MNEQIFYRAFRPDPPLADWVRVQQRPVIVHLRDLPTIQESGTVSVVTLPHGGPQPGEAWVEVQI